MNKHIEMVKRFQEKHGFPVGIGIGSDPKTDLVRVHLIGEENAEFALALAEKDPIKVADALGDLTYVVFGAAVVYGIPLQEVFEEIHFSNMTKAVRHPDDTRLRDKGESYRPANIPDALARGMSRKQKPKVVCLCGSTKFKDEFEHVNRIETLKGNIVLSVGFYCHQEGDWVSDSLKMDLDELHKRKIDLCDEVLVINVNGYIGQSTRSEIQYAANTRKPVRYVYDSEFNHVAQKGE